jgi:hypothetical protein
VAEYKAKEPEVTDQMNFQVLQVDPAVGPNKYEFCKKPIQPKKCSFFDTHMSRNFVLN